MLDLCCGIGTIGIYCADLVDTVIGIEMEESAIEMAKENAILNKCSNTYYICGKVEEKLLGVDVELGLISSDYVFIAVLDPSRSGLPPKLIKQIRNIRNVDEII